MRLPTTTTAAFLLAALLPLAACADNVPGRHPAYLHALSDLRAAHWLLEHQPGDARVYAGEDVAINETDATYHEIRRASIDDGKDLHDHPALDVNGHGSRLLRAIEALKQARADIDQEEDNPEVHELRHRAHEHLDKAIHAAEAAHNAWLREHGE
ncbi:hypothetical protein [Ideonella sp. B508-1]|uniref:hypothetical protein n=1 Tax=Ideonella sp. B508-1 TaxID=137716 RepID=UPI0011D185F1|nr:hypothetical protein [Ideonella sp. B508-1]